MEPAVAAEESWDFFLSYAKRDRARCEVLADLLDEQGWKVFLDARSIKPGDDWLEALTGALKRTRVAVVLLSAHSAEARYQREEIELTLRHAKRRRRLKVVPVYLDGLPDEPAAWEFGLRRFHFIDLYQDGVAGVADKLGRLLSEAPPEPEPGPAGVGEAQQTVGDVLHGATLRIDRTKQWLPLVEICRTKESALFLLHGPRRQNLDLFISRLVSYLPAECGYHHHPYFVPLNVEYARPRSAAAWENHLREGIAKEGGGGGTAEDLLREAARAHPVFLFLSKLPIDAHDLDEAEREALGDFLDDRLPALIARAAEGRHPIRALLATHYEQAESALVSALDERAHRACDRHGIRYRKLLPVQPLEWEDIEDFLYDLPKRPPRHVFEQLRTAFEQLDRGSVQFRDLLTMLAQRLF